MRTDPRNIVFLLGFVALMILREVFKRRARGNQKTVSRLDAPEKILLFIVMTIIPLLPLLYMFTPWLSFADYRLPSFTTWCGTLFMAAAVWLFWRSHADLGLNWSETLQLRAG